MSDAPAKRPMSNRKYLSIWTPIIAIIVALVIAANLAIQVYLGWVESQLGTGTWEVENAPEAENWDTDYHSSQYASLDEAQQAAAGLIEEIAGEGITLLKNADGALPIAAGAVTLFGRTAAEPVYGGSGSGSVDVSTAVNVRGGLEHAGFEINEAVYETLQEFADDADRTRIAMDDPESSTFAVGEMPVDGYDGLTDTFAEYSDAAIVVFGRGGGEGGDLAIDMQGWDDNYFEGQHELMLNVDEQETLELAKENFEDVIVVINSSNIMEIGVLEDDPDVDAVLWTGAPGQTGFNALGDILTGEINPSGRTVDLWASDFSADPTYLNFGRWEYTNVDGSNASVIGGSNNADMEDGAFFVELEEGIYYGYRFYETAAEEDFIDYDEAVVYPFGHGLSYTDFEWELAGSTEPDVDGVIEIDVEVTNTGDVAGKETVQLYYTAPYTPGGIEKAHVVLADFAKTGLLEPGASETVTVEVPVEEMASYDYEGAGAFVLEEGTYELKIQTDSHNLAEGIEPVEYEVSETIVYDESNPRSNDDVAAGNQFDEVSDHFSGSADGEGAHLMSRADFGGTFPTAPTEQDQVASDDIIASFQEYDHEAAAEASDAEMPTTGAGNGMALIDLRGLAYDDPAWDELLDQLTVDEMTTMLLNGAYNTDGIASIAKPRTNDIDGPHGFTSFINRDFNGAAYPSAPVIAATWNKELLYRMGEMLGEEALHMGVSGWYAPGVNLHRSPFAGRNFEYYSEDPIISGILGAEVVSGAASMGLYTYTKHFALNDQELGRVDNGIATWVDEQTMREIYLKPFETIVKESSAEIPYVADESGTIETAEIGSMAMMSAFNRVGATWAGGDSALLGDVLREEWGFRGVVITDFNLYEYMYPDQSIAAGTDLQLTMAPMKSFEDTSSAEAVTNIRTATHNVLFAVANSNAMNGFAPGAEIDYTPPTWRYIQLGVTVVIGLVLAFGVYRIVRRVQRHSGSQAAVVAGGPADGTAETVETR